MRKFWCVLMAITMVVCVNADAFAGGKHVSKREAPTNIQKIENTSKAGKAERPFLVKHGMRGDDVKLVQRLLNGLGYPVGEADGICGAMTTEAIKFFQKMNNLPENGVVGEETLAFMNRAEPLSSRNMRSLVMHATGYSAYDPGNGQYTATGSFLRKGLVAVDPGVIPLGTRLYIPGYGYAVAADTGGAIQGHRIDLAFDSHGEAIQFGRRDITVYIVD